MTSLRYLRMFLHEPDGTRRSIGFLSRFGDVHRVSFDEEYAADPRRPTLSLSYRGETDADTQAILRAAKDARLVRSDGHFPPFFQNLLPEGHNRERLARERGCAEEDELELLAAAGHDLFGAIELEPPPADQELPRVVRVWHAALGAEELETEPVEVPLEDGASLPGVVTKFSAIKVGRRYVIKKKGKVGAYILKLPSTRHPDLVDNELTGYRLAGALGLQCAEAERVERARAELPERVAFPHVLAVKRFDRAGPSRRIHMEEMAQALGYEPRQKYGRGIEHDLPRMLRILDRLSARPAEDVAETVRRFVAFILMGNTDAHLKNWALLYPDGVEPVLAPLYDPVCVSAWFDELPPAEYALNRKIDATFRAFDWADVESVLKASGIARVARSMSIARDTVKMARATWPGVLKDAPDNVRKAVSERLGGGVALCR